MEEKEFDEKVVRALMKDPINVINEAAELPFIMFEALSSVIVAGQMHTMLPWVAMSKEEMILLCLATDPELTRAMIDAQLTVLMSSLGLQFGMDDQNPNTREVRRRQRRRAIDM